MYEHQLGVVNKKDGVDDVVAFLKTLTGEIPKILEDKSKTGELTLTPINKKGVN